MVVNLTLTSDFPYWVKETTFVFRKLSDSGGASSFRDYSFDYPVDYTPTNGSKDLDNTGFVGTNFRMVIYGACVNPSVYVNGHKYQVNCTVAEGEYLTIDSVSKTVILTENDGSTVNKFNSREKDSYDLGDVVGAYDNVTQISICAEITKKIVTVKNGQITISYEVGE